MVANMTLEKDVPNELLDRYLAALAAWPVAPDEDRAADAIRNLYQALDQPQPTVRVVRSFRDARADAESTTSSSGCAAGERRRSSALPCRGVLPT